jgi:hypothetical protein
MKIIGVEKQHTRVRRQESYVLGVCMSITKGLHSHSISISDCGSLLEVIYLANDYRQCTCFVQRYLLPYIHPHYFLASLVRKE